MQLTKDVNDGGNLPHIFKLHAVIHGNVEVLNRRQILQQQIHISIWTVHTDHMAIKLEWHLTTKLNK